MTYRAAPITQRDGSALANSNCRMASLATGLDYHTEGELTSTGSRMRSYTSDQSGGTDSGDAVEAWQRGYRQSLSVRDGYTFDNALQDLERGSLVHLDVWHASCGSAAGICKSGSGSYGHTIAVAPEWSSSGWLVADPWCSPPKWGRVPEAQLRAGAEEWGRRVYGTAVLEADYPTTGGRIGDPRDVVGLAIIRRIVAELMTRARPGLEWIGPAPETPPDWGETGGGKPILFTRTRALEETDMPGLALTDLGSFAGSITMQKAGASAITVDTQELVGLPVGTVKPAYMTARLALGFLGWPAGTEVLVIGDDAAAVIRAEVEVDETGTGDEYERGRADEWQTWAQSLGIPPEPG